MTEEMAILKAGNIEKIIDSLDLARLGQKVAIKVHFGEKGCTTYVDPLLVKAVYDKVTSLGKEATLIECNVLYKGSRTVTKDHLTVANDHGFTFSPIHICDGEKGQDSVEVPLEGLSIKTAKIGVGVGQYDSMVVISHFKGHLMAGYGGALKNVGMGLGSRAGKLHMHATVSPSINKEKCVMCGVCIDNCPEDAISEDAAGKAEIDSQLCIGCAQCIEVCSEGAAQIPWSSIDHQTFLERIADYTIAVLHHMDAKDKTIYINVLQNITKECDCWGEPQSPFMEDIGILAGYDPVAIDQASLDLINNKQGVSDQFKELHPRTDNHHLLIYAEEKRLGTTKYHLVEL